MHRSVYFYKPQALTKWIVQKDMPSDVGGLTDCNAVYPCGIIALKVFNQAGTEHCSPDGSTQCLVRFNEGTDGVKDSHRAMQE